MLKLSFLKRIVITSLFLLLALILYNFPKEMSAPIDESSYNSKVYLIDDNEFVSLVKTTCNINTNSVRGVFESLTSTTCFPYGFSSYVPNNTKLLDYSINGGLLKLNFSKELLDVKSGYEEKMLESLIYSFTSIEDINKIMIFVNDELLNKFPKSDVLLPITFDRSFGINKIVDITTLSDNVSFNVYYLSKNVNDYYYVPVTYIVNEDGDIADMIIKRLKSNNISSSLLTHLNYNVEMISYELSDGTMEVTFDNDLKNMLFDGELSESVEYALVASFKDSFGIENVNILFNS